MKSSETAGGAPGAPAGSGPTAGNGNGGEPPSRALNWISLTGFGLIVIGFGAGVLTLALEFTSPQAKAYTGVLFLAYLLIIFVGLALIPSGMVRESRRRARGVGSSMNVSLVFDLRKKSHRTLALASMVLGAVVMLSVTVGSYQAYQATESNLFCGQVCHKVMQPEYTAYQYSAHARVKCVECHIGSGAGWYVRSKLSGMRQVFAVTLNTYPRPIPTPIHDLRPARETCEECHWPQKFIGFKEMVRSYFLSDEENTPHRIRMLMKIGGEEHSLMKGSGIHYHMLLANSVEYLARDYDRQKIAWVRVTHDDGTVEVFEDQDDPLTDEEHASLEQDKRKMDCMDCHNRPSHKFPAPMAIVNQALDVGALSRDLPYIKVEAVKALDGGYKTTPQAMSGIESAILGFYRDEYPDVYNDEPLQLGRAVAELQDIYKRSIFPEMGASWAAYPDNIGHRDWPGCFRCHNDRLQTEEGKTIFTTCNKCHLIIAQGANVDQVEVNVTEGLKFEHPGDDGDTIEEYTECTDCHSGGKLVYE